MCNIIRMPCYFSNVELPEEGDTCFEVAKLAKGWMPYICLLQVHGLFLILTIKFIA